MGVHITLWVSGPYEGSWEGHSDVELRMQRGGALVEGTSSSDGVRFSFEARLDEAGVLWAKEIVRRPQERFVYLAWGSESEHGWSSFWRMKVRMDSTPEVQDGDRWEVRIEGTDKMGEPRCATVRTDLADWSRQ